MENFLSLFLKKLYIVQYPEILWSWKCKPRLRCTTFAMAPFDGKYLTCNLMAMVMLALSLTICEIFAKIIKYQKCSPWKWRSRSRIRRIWFPPFDWKCSNSYKLILQNFNFPVTLVCTKRIRVTRDRVEAIGKNRQSRFLPDENYKTNVGLKNIHFLYCHRIFNFSF